MAKQESLTPFSSEYSKESLISLLPENSKVQNGLKDKNMFLPLKVGHSIRENSNHTLEKKKKQNVLVLYNQGTSVKRNIFHVALQS